MHVRRRKFWDVEKAGERDWKEKPRCSDSI